MPDGVNVIIAENDVMEETVGPDMTFASDDDVMRQEVEAAAASAHEEVVLIEVPADNMEHLGAGLDAGSGVVHSLQAAFIGDSPQHTGQVTIMSQSASQEVEETVSGLYVI